jgi:hypothetical protein
MENLNLKIDSLVRAGFWDADEDGFSDMKDCFNHSKPKSCG